MRLFLAIAIPAAVETELRQLQKELKLKLTGARIGWIRPGQFHLTLKFFGEIIDSRLDNLRKTLDSAVHNFGELSLTAQRVGLFPERGRPRILWAGVREAQERLNELHKRIQSCTLEFGDNQAGQRFAGHVTLGRIRELSREDESALLASVEALETKSFGSWTARELLLMRSELAPEGARYSLVASFPLQS